MHLGRTLKWKLDNKETRVTIGLRQLFTKGLIEMANVVTLLSVEILDHLGVTVSHDIFIENADTLTLANLNTFAATYLNVLDPIIDGQITAATFKVKATLPTGIKTAPAATAEAERNGVFNFSQANVPYKNGIAVPTIADSVIVNGKIDLTNTSIQSWITVITVVSSGITVISKFLNALQNLVDAFISFRKHRRAELRRSFEV